MLRILDVQSMRNSDAATIAGGVPGRELMGRAGEEIFRSAEWKTPVAIVCGTGNNAGDGYVTAVRMAEEGIPCRIFLQDRRFTPDGAYWYQKCEEKNIPVQLWRDTKSLSGFASVLDCIFGTGFRNGISGEAERLIDLINQSGAYVVSADINSGLNGDSGMAEKAVRSDLTVSVGWFQPGHFLNMAMDLMSRKVNREIGIVPVGPDRFLMEAADVAAMFPPRKHFSNKGNYGYLGLIGGCRKYPGAIRLASAANAAMRAGAGVVKAAVPESLCAPLMPLMLESTLFPLREGPEGVLFAEEEWRELISRVRVIAAGMGMENTEETRKGLQFLLRHYEGTLIIDADGLNALAMMLGHQPDLLRQAGCEVLLTPHPGEFSRLTGKTIAEIQQNSLELAESFARQHGVTLLLKGPATLVTDGKNTLFVDRGSPGMATAGSGDVLSGILAAVCAGNASLPMKAAAGAWLNGRAGEIAQEKTGDVSMLAGDTVQAIPQALREIRKKASPG